MYTQLIEQTIYILWVQALRKVLMILRYMQKRTFTDDLKGYFKYSKEKNTTEDQKQAKFIIKYGIK